MSIRRSSRTNKGVHSQRLELAYADEPRNTENESGKRVQIEPNTSVKKAKMDKPVSSSKPAWVKIEGESVRCLPCGTTDLNYNEEEEDPFGMMIECVRCNTWQHVKCMFGAKTKEKDIPDNYKCDVCDPSNPAFSNLRRKLSYARYLKLRLGTSADQTEDSVDYSVDDQEKDAGAINDDENDQEYFEGGLSNKSTRNAFSVTSDDELSGDQEKDRAGRSRKKLAKKNVNISPPVVETDSKSATPSAVYDTLRTRIVKNLELKLVELVPKSNNENILRGKTIGELAREWAITLEKGIYETFPNYKADHTKYIDKARSLLTNLKISRLVERVISGEFTIEQLPKLSTEEMRTPEEKKKAEEVRQQALNQVVIKNDVSNLPKTRLTHRGEEIIGDTDYQFDINDRRNDEVEKIKDKMKKQELEKQEREQEREFDGLGSPPQFMMGANLDDEGEGENETNPHHPTHSNGLSDDEGSFIGGHTKKADGEEVNHDLLDDDDFDKILNDTLGKKFEEKPKKQSGIAEKTAKKVAGKQKVEKKVKFMEAEETGKIEQRTTKDMWEGTLGSPELSFSCKIDFVSSTCKPSKRNIIESAFRMINENAVATNGYINKGRLNAEVADNYLDKITTSKDLYLFEVLPFEEDEQSGTSFMKMWSYYHGSSKYAVLKNSVAYIRDTYLLALSRERMIDGEESAIVLSKFPADEIMEHLEESKSESKLYILSVVQRDMDNFKPIRIPPKTMKTNPTIFNPPVRSENDHGESENGRENKNENKNQKEDENEKMKEDLKVAVEGDDDYDPALSVTLSKLTGGSNTQSAPDLALASLMKNLS
ncbi:hypothetical protein PICMEDRAFT_77588 [Pichia membranifaciens NRRL Y-2026]|uniref:Transcription factor BYE1 n=1 Tax=Pichia membranifaciens NRRL Y-2026 TaxID=763406 RepID=A0A1E3NKD6_9ASCO|nr:hypothetical protein PICMEDRAFT_77588 [Pichia membranifaciens NRRL Y-2026]ODQ46546.1 hypothetical protein PICMEDRAFT_77588 [Pichia membranifaciens NRRL Y-2026]